MRDIEALAYTSALALACTFALAGSAKLVRLSGTRSAFRAMGLPVPGLLAPAVALAELALAVLLVLAPRPGGAAALAMLGAFTLILGGTMRRGLQVSCGCFGTAGHEAVSAATLVRNGLLAVPALAATAAAHQGMPGLPEVVFVSAGFLGGELALALIELRSRAGGVWSNRMAFESMERP